jgi:hypothetical protein
VVADEVEKAAARVLARSERRGDFGCLVWTGCLDSGGYGQIRVGGRKGRTRRVHQVVYEAAHGPVPPGLELDHLCRRRDCVDLRHLEVVSHAENVRRGDAAKPGRRHSPETRAKISAGVRRARRRRPRWEPR